MWRFRQSQFSSSLSGVSSVHQFSQFSLSDVYFGVSVRSVSLVQRGNGSQTPGAVGYNTCKSMATKKKKKCNYIGCIYRGFIVQVVYFSSVAVSLDWGRSSIRS